MPKEDMTFQERLRELWRRFSIRISFKDKMTFTKYLSVLLNSGMPIDEAVAILHKQSSGSMEKILKTLKEQLNLGNTLTDGLNEYEHVFGPVYTNLISAGEASGTLQKNLEHLETQLEKDYEVRRKVKGAMVYPIIVVVGAILISVGIVVFVLPNVLQIFSSLDVELPLPTQILLWIAETTRDHGVLTALASIGVVVFAIVIWSIPVFKPFFHRLLLSVPIVGPIVRKTNLARMTRLISVMLQSGMSIDEAIPLTKQVLKNAQYRRLLDRIQTNVQRGRSITSVFKDESKLVPPMVMQVVSAGEQAGTLDEMLGYMADFYENELDDTMQNLSSILEPVLLIFVGLLVGGLALSVLMPIYQVVGSF